MKFFLIKRDPDWSFQRGVQCYTDSQWRMPGIYCPAHPRVATYCEGYSYPAADFKDAFLKRALRWGLDVPDKDSNWQEQFKQPDRWLELHQRLLAVLPYPVVISPGTSLGPVTAEISGEPADVLLSSMHGHMLLAASAVENLRAKGIVDLFAAPCNVKSKRKREVYVELQIEHQVELAGSLDSSGQTMRRKLGYPMKCAQCGCEWGALPKRIVLKGDTIPANVTLFRLRNQPNAIFCNEAFARVATDLKLTNLLLVPTKTDGSEKKRGFVRVEPSRPLLWPQGIATGEPRVAPKRRIPLQKLPAFPSAGTLLAKQQLKVAVALEPLSQPSVRFMPNPAKDLPVGQSRIGGLPDLPKGAAWPSPRRSRLDFLLQVNLAEVSRHYPESPLPKTGLLSFFYDNEHCPWGLDPKDKGGWAVLFHEGSVSALARAPLPEWMSQDALLPACSLAFALVDSMPASNSPTLASVQFTAAAREGYGKVLRRLRWPLGREIPVHRLLGYPDTIQNDMALECALASAGLNASVKPNLKDAKQRKIAATAKDWRLLLQLDTKPRLGLE